MRCPTCDGSMTVPELVDGKPGWKRCPECEVRLGRTTGMIVRMKENDARLKLKKGDVLLVKPYPLDPASKFTVIRRLSDDFDPECNVYRHQVETINTRT